MSSIVTPSDTNQTMDPADQQALLDHTPADVADTKRDREGLTSRIASLEAENARLEALNAE